MKNVEYKVVGGGLVITIPDLKADFGASSTGKTNTVGSTGGFVNLAEVDGVSFSVNVIRKKAKA